ncbi:MAG: hypothetical protein ABL885_00725 [Methylophilaceae bacterium]
MFSSGWLQHLVDKAGKTPLSRIEAIFHILHDWLKVPDMRQKLRETLVDSQSQRELKAYLLQLVQASGTARPEMVTEQIYMVLLGALSDEIRHAGSDSLLQAGQAALMLVKAQTPVRRTNDRKFAMAISVMVTTGSLAGFLAFQQSPGIKAPLAAQKVAAISTVSSPDKASALYHLHEQVRMANCSYPQALMLPSEQRAPFIERVVNGNVGGLQPESMAMVNQLYQKLDCYYPPAAMLL